MRIYETKNIRNVGLYGHQSSGKTSIGEAFLFLGKTSTRLCSVNEGNSNFDFDAEEIKRRLSISTAIGYAEWKKNLVNVVDTPGDTNFLVDTMISTMAVDAGIVVISASDSIEVGTEKVWSYLNDENLPRLIFINKMDKERADFDKVLSDIAELFGNSAVLFQIPVGSEMNFKGVVDLLSMKCYLYEADQSGAGREAEIPLDMKQKAQEMREKLVEKIAEQEDALIEKYFETGTLTDDELVTGIKRGIENNTIVPVLCGSASLLFAIDRLLDCINAYFPDPLCRKVKVKDQDGSTGEWKPSAENPFTGYVFKTIIDPFAGKLTLFRVYSGTISADSSFYNASIGVWERFGSIYKLVGKRQVPVGTAMTGDLVAIAKLKETRTTHTLAADEKQPVFVGIKTPPPSISFAVKPKTQGDEDRVSSALQKLMEEDSGITLGRDDEAKEFLIHGMGQSHVEITVEKMKSKFGVDVELKPPKIPYRETIKGTAKNIEGKHKKQSGGRGQFGVCYIDIEPLPRGAGFEFVNDIFGGAIPRNFIPSVEKGILDAMAKGVIAGYPVVDVKVRLFDGKYHDVDSDNRSFEIAGSKGFKLAFKQAKPTLLEPIMNMTIVILDEDMGSIIGDINSRRGRILGMDSKGRNQVVKAQVPMAEVLKYSSDLRSMTSGRGTFTMEFSHYEEVPAMIAEKIIAAAQLKEEEE